MKFKMKINFLSSILGRRNILIGKKGDYRFSDTALYIIVFLLISLFIAWGMNIFYSYHLDVREEETKILSDKLFSAVVLNGEVNEKIFYDNLFNILKDAGINKKIISDGDFYFSVVISGDGKEKKFVEGNRDIGILCESDGERLPVCNKKEAVLGNYEIKILTASNQVGSGA